METENIAKIIKDIRKKHNLTQKQLADKLNVTYQAVSKWENGKNIPDIALLKEISNTFDIDINELIGSSKKKKSKILISVAITIFIFLLLIILIFFFKKESDDFTFKTLSASCQDFTISGSIAYNEKKSAIYISNIEYCGGDDIMLYDKIECTLYEEESKVRKEIKSCGAKENITLEDFLKDVTITVDNYKQDCIDYSHNNLYLEITASVKEGRETHYKVPLTLKDSCTFK